MTGRIPAEAKKRSRKPGAGKTPTSLAKPALVLLLAHSSFGAAPPTVPESSVALRAELRTLRDAETKRLAALGLPQEPDTVPPPPAGPTRFVPLPEVVPAAPRAQAPPEDKTIRGKTAEALFRLAGEAAQIRRYALADECLRGVLARVPDHPEARRLLGFLPHAGGWATPYAAKLLRDGWTLHPVFGWVEADWVPHLDRGELPAYSLPGRPRIWLPTAEADAQHAEFAHAWKIETAHFQILSNVPLAEVIGFSHRLEAFHDAFFALLADLIGPELPLAQRFRSPGPPKPTTRLHKVRYYGSQSEYVSYLRPLHGDFVEKELGRYDRARQSRPGVGGTSYFYRTANASLAAEATLYHEASHQLLFESAGTWAFSQNSGQFWVFEGLGTYFETLTHEPDGSLRIGGLVGPRIAKARALNLAPDGLTPIEPFVELGEDGFNEDHIVYDHYAEAMALAVFLLHADDERHREPFLDYALAAYKGRVQPGRRNSLSDLTGLPFARLDSRFRAFMREPAR